ncbi:EAL domain-containing protein [Magnetospirillum sp. 64-120]|uniref:EAL domain-containing protein n=1 Tax=Magnetospirillum sp. 64-120 TaxID=1895778 RepID=UPI0025C0F25D|nr:EAL domain-containing protein [Magnetospirillum sp. 64-120]
MDSGLGSENTIDRITKREILSCAPGTTIYEAAKAMSQARCSSIIIVDDGQPIGIWTERDTLSVDFSDPESFGRPIASVMSTPIKTIHGKTNLGDAGLRFQLEGVRHFVVVDDSGKPVGVVSQSDVILRHGVEHFLVLRNVGSSVKQPMVKIAPGAALSTAVEMMGAMRADAAVVVGDHGEAPGIITERDLLRIIAAGGEMPPNVGAIASRPLITVNENDSLLSARNTLEERRIRHLAVVSDSGELKGLLSFSDILSSLQYEYVQRLDEALRERDEALLRSRKDLHIARKVIEASLDGIMICNPSGMIEFVNPAFSQLTGYAFDEVVGHNPSMLQSGLHDRSFYDRMWQSLHVQGIWQGEIWNRRKSGEVYPEWLTINVIRDEDGVITQYAAVFSDISERKKTEERIKNLAYFDVLTGLPNRRLFTDRLQVAIAHAHRHGAQMAIMFLDLDLFKRINDSLGHGIGDQVLCEVANRLQACVREGDTVARLGGDEFVILLPELDHVEDAAKLADRVISRVKQPLSVDEHELYVTTSVGIAVYPDDGLTDETLIKNADTAMYRAKDLGRNSYQLYTPAMNAKSFERLAMESSLRHALNRGEFTLVYQGKIDLVSGRMSGVEALVRWRHPEMGLVSPAEFIPLAENMGLISEIGAWVLKAACRQSQSWFDLGLPRVRIAVNVSTLQFREGDLAELVKQALQESGLPPQFLELEITESVLMQRVDENAQVLQELRAMGIHISIDDFGTGYSSLSYLKRMPIDALKIDRSFVKDITEDGDGAAIVSTIINLAHNLKLRAVAEGVETQDQADFLRQRGCDEIQGFLVSRPVSAEDLVSLFDRNLL